MAEVTLDFQEPTNYQDMAKSAAKGTPNRSLKSIKWGLSSQLKIPIN